MKTHTLIQGGAEWHAYRATVWNASDAPAMMGCSPYKTREQLLQELATGVTEEVATGLQRRFDDGHRFEALARPLAEEIIGEELFPVTGSSDDVIAGRALSASFDGMNMLETVAWEHKTLNNELRSLEVFDGQSLPLLYRVQMEQQLMVSGAQRILFMASKWGDDQLIEELHCWYYPDPELQAKIVAGWAQLAADLETWKPQAVEVKPVGKSPETLPALRIEVSGQVTASNLVEFKAHALEVIRSIKRDPSTDEEFADAERTVKWCGEVESRLEAAKQHALSQTATIDELFKAIDDIAAEAKRTRLELDKLVKARKEQIREEIVTEGRSALAAHIASLNTRLGKPYMPTVPADFAGAIKGKRTVESLRDAVNTTLAHAKIQANEIADRIQVNLNTLRELASDHAFLFADTPVIVLKAPDDLTMLVKSRVADHKQAEADRLEAERERIRAEEAARLEREQAEAQAQAQREAQQAEAKRIQAENDHAAAQRASLVPTEIPQAQQPQQVLKAEPAPVLADATDRGTAVIESPRGGAMGAGQAAAAAPAGEPATLKLGTIGERLGFTLTEAFVSEVLGIKPSGKDKRAVLYRESDFSRICDALSRHVLQAKAGELLAA